MGSHVNENEATLTKKGPGGWRIGSFPQNLAWIHAPVSGKPELKDDGRLPHDSSSADKSSRAKMQLFYNANVEKI